MAVVVAEHSVESHHTHGNLRLASSAQPDRSINHGLISGNPSIAQVMVLMLPLTIAVKC